MRAREDFGGTLVQEVPGVGVLLAWGVVILALGAGIVLLKPVYALALVGASIAIALAMQRPAWAIALVLAAIPLEIAVVDIGPVGLSAVQMATLFVVMLMLVEMLAKGRMEIPKTPLDVPALVWTAALFLGAIGAYDPAAAIKKAGLTVIFMGLFYLVVAKVRGLDVVELLTKTLVLACSVVGAYGVYVSYRYVALGAVTGNSIVVGSEGLAVPRAASTVGDPTLLGGLMVLSIPIAVMLVATTRRWERVGWVACLGILFASLGFTFTRGAWMGAAAGLAVLLFDKRARRVLIVVLLLILLLSPGAIWQRAATSTNLGRAEISHRFDYWVGALLVTPQRPLFGIGLGNFKYAFARLPVPETAQRVAIHAHNVFLVLLSETGLVGFFAMGALVLGSLWLLLRWRGRDPSPDRRAWRLAIAASILGSLLHQMSDSFLLEPTVNAIVWVYFGLAVLFGLGMLSADDAGSPSASADATALESGSVIEGGGVLEGGGVQGASVPEGDGA